MSCIYTWVQPDPDPPIYAFHIAGMTDMSHSVQLSLIEICALANLKL
jgi:hypothetical protein